MGHPLIHLLRIHQALALTSCVPGTLSAREPAVGKGQLSPKEPFSSEGSTARA